MFYWKSRIIKQVTLEQIFSTGKVQHLTEKQSSLLANLFRTNVDLGRELKKHECEQVIKKYPILSSFTWEKVKNTVHNWITAEKRKMKK